MRHISTLKPKYVIDYFFVINKNLEIYRTPEKYNTFRLTLF